MLLTGQVVRGSDGLLLTAHCSPFKIQLGNTELAQHILIEGIGGVLSYPVQGQDATLELPCELPEHNSRFQG